MLVFGKCIPGLTTNCSLACDTEAKQQKEERGSAVCITIHGAETIAGLTES